MIDQGELFEIPNPCRGVCIANNRGYCKGCLRSRIERQHWYELTAYQQQQVINLCERRRQKILAGPVEAAPEEETDISQLDLFIADTVAEQVENERQEQNKVPEAAESTEQPIEQADESQATQESASKTEAATSSTSNPATTPATTPPTTSDKKKGDQFDLF